MNQNTDRPQDQRKVPFSILLQLLFGGFHNQFGWMFFGFGMIFVLLFGAHTDMSRILFATNKVNTASGIITAIEQTSARENHISIFANKYTFRISGNKKIFKSISFTPGRVFEVEQQVTIEYLAGNPEISRIQGARRAEFSPESFFFIPVFPIIGLIFIIMGVYKGVKAAYLLGRGRAGEGILVSKQPTSTSINKQRVYKLTFEFTADDGHTYTASTRTHEPRLLEDDAKERLFYDPLHPSFAVMFDDLPGLPGFDEAGWLKPQPLKALVLPLIVPALAVAINAIILILVL